MNLDEVTAFCDAWLPAWTGNRPDALIAFYDDAAYYQDPANPAGLRGRAALLDYLRRLLRRNPDWTWERVEVMPTERGFTLKWRATFPFPDRQVQVFGLDLVEVSRGRITRNEVYFDTAPLRGPG